MSSGRIGKTTALLSLLAFGCAFALSAFFYASRHHQWRTVMYFRSYDSDDLCTEVRYLPLWPAQGREALFVDELLLGPASNRYKRIFPRGTTAEFCLVQDGILYVGLNKDAFFVTAETKSIREGVALLQVNIVKNFTNINKIDVFIDGKSILADEPIAALADGI